MKVVSRIILALLLLAVLTSVVNFCLVKATPGTIIYILPNGNVDPAGVPILRDGDVYTFTGNIEYPTYEGIVVQKSNVIVDGDGYILEGDPSAYGNGFYLSGISNVTIENTNIKKFYNAISLDSSSNYNNVSGNNITNNDYAVRLSSSSYNTLSGNNIINCGAGINVWSSSHNTISGNKITITGIAGCAYGVSFNSGSRNIVSGNEIIDCSTGVQLDYTTYNTISENNIANSIVVLGLDRGVELVQASHNIISGNNITNWNFVSVDLDGSNNNTISENKMTHEDYGAGTDVKLSGSSDNTVSGNIIANAYNEGVALYSSSRNTISGNDITDNFHFGVFLDSASDNKFYHNNFINNSDGHVKFGPDVGSGNVWDDGYPSGGNYWSDYAGDDYYHGPNQDELGGDGIGDTSYGIEESGTDRYPLMNPWGTSPPSYDVTINAHCNTEAIDPHVSITMDGSPTGYLTPHTFTGLTFGHMFTVPDTDPSGHSFKQWNTDETSTTIDVNSEGTYTAYYEAKIVLTITTTTGGTANPSPGTHTYWEGTVVNVTAIAYTDYIFEHWELDEVNVGSTNPISVTMDSDHTLHAVFIYSPSGVGGIIIPVDKLALLAPYVAFAIAVVAITIGVAYAWKRWLGKAAVQKP